MNAEEPRSNWLRVALGFAALKLALHLAVAGYFTPHYGYGFFTDEFYYLDCGRRLAWGYVDQPPLVAVLAKLALLLGGSLFAVRLVPAVCGALMVLLTGMVARETGARATGVAVACACVFAAPVYLFEDSYLSMNALEPVLWLAIAWLVLRLFKSGDRRLWVAIGVAVGVALLNKYTAAPFVLALLVGILLTPERALLRSRWFAVGVLVAAAVVLPNVVWQWRHGWAFLVFLAGKTSSGVNLRSGPLQFFFQQDLALGFLTVGYCVGGLLWLLFGPSARRFRALGWAYVFTAALLLLSGGKHYYLEPAGAMLFAAGGTVHDLFVERTRRRPAWVLAPVALCLVSFVMIAPFSLPAFPLEYEQRLAQRWSDRRMLLENHPEAKIYPHFAEMMGWPEMAQAVSRAYLSLPPEQQARTAVYAWSYSRAGALDYYRAQYPVRLVLSGHVNYFLWGTQGFHGDSLLVVGPMPNALAPECSELREVGRVYNQWAMPDTAGPILLCSGLKRPLSEIWPQLRRWN